MLFYNYHYISYTKSLILHTYFCTSKTCINYIFIYIYLHAFMYLKKKLTNFIYLFSLLSKKIVFVTLVMMISSPLKTDEMKHSNGREFQKSSMLDSFLLFSYLQPHKYRGSIAHLLGK